MPDQVAASTPGGFLLVLALMLPVAGVLPALVLGGRHAERIALALTPVGLGLAIAIAAAVLRADAALVYVVGGWAPPLGIALRADGLSAAMLLTTAVVIGATALFARADFATPPGAAEARAPLAFWTLLLGVWAAMNAVLLGDDLFNLFVALELLTFSAVPLVCLDGRAETLRAALRYLLFALLGSVLYLLGVALLYGSYGTLDIPLLADLVRPTPPTLAAAALMTTGLLAKTALFPLHLWLPPAHAGAPAPASAVLSGLVIKGSWFLVVRLWFDVLPGVVTVSSAQLLGGLGAAAILVGNVVALRQERLKLLVAYSTVAQIGYLFLMFPLAFGAAAALERGTALSGGTLQAISHATAKAAMFMAVGTIYKALGHDRIAGLAGVGRALPISMLTFVLAGVALMGLPPSGAYVAKKLLLGAAAESGQWWWDVVMQVGGILTASYVVLVLAHAFAPARGAVRLRAPVSRLAETAAFALALCSLLLGFAAAGAGLPDALSSALSPAELGAALVLIVGGALVASALADRLPQVPVGGFAAVGRPIRRATLAVGAMFVGIDGALRQWSVAGLALVVLAVAFGAAMIARS